MIRQEKKNVIEMNSRFVLSFELYIIFSSLL